MGAKVVERILRRFEAQAEGYGWVFDGSQLWEQAQEKGKSYAEAKYDIVYALLDAIRKETGRDILFVIDALPEDDDDTEFVIFEDGKVISHYHFVPTDLSLEFYRGLVEEILQDLGIVEITE